MAALSLRNPSCLAPSPKSRISADNVPVYCDWTDMGVGFNTDHAENVPCGGVYWLILVVWRGRLPAMHDITALPIYQNPR